MDGLGYGWQYGSGPLLRLDPIHLNRAGQTGVPNGPTRGTILLADMSRHGMILFTGRIGTV